MSVLVVGECLGTIEQEREGRNGPFVVTSIVVLDGMKTEYVEVASREKFRGDLPVAGDLVALECAVRAFLRRDGKSVGYGFAAFGRSSKVESALPARAEATV